MAEGANIEVAHHLTEQAHGTAPRGEHHRTHRTFEVVEVLLLSVVAIVTAWSGDQAASWDGEQTRLYAAATSDRFDAEELDSAAVAELTNDTSLTTAWLEAAVAGDAALQAALEKRMTPSYKRAFDAWVATDPLENPDAPASPSKMPQYRNPFREKARALNASAETKHAEGTTAREHGEKYVRNTVLLAMVLFLAAIAQRFTDPLLRGVLNGLALAILVFALASLASLPRA
jgi:hypothetical protein